ncbi:hypothetical protein NLI96_g298 [Meripilus lineatus]|uniref:F-box domain-containing protein n=1 Tax=Meripilus lineatus TaxID=2056292 RepID=A0AAD5VCR4_9APHY|nr:hypothetical protein NLI96_g298 [Physisporinus lineatus]
MSELSLVATPPSVDSRTPRGDFPPELVREIAENLAGDFKALLTFSLLCHHWRNASRPILFTKVNIRNPQRLEEFIAIINEDPSIAYQARELVLGRPLDFETRWFQGIDSTLGKRLPNLTKLQIYGLRFYSIKDDPTLTRLKIFQDLISGFSSLDSLKISISVLPSNIMPKILTYAKKLKTLSFDACFPIFVDPDAEDEEDELSADKGAIETVPKDRSLGTSVHFGWPLVNSYELTDMASYLAFQFFVIRSSGPHKTIKLSVPGSSWRELALSTVEDIIDQHKYTLEDLTLEIPTHSTLSNSESLKISTPLGKELRRISRLKYLNFQDTVLLLINQIVDKLDPHKLPNVTVTVGEKYISNVNEYFPAHVCRSLDILFSTAPNKPSFGLKLAAGGPQNTMELLRARFPRLFAEQRIRVREGHKMYRIARE